MKEDRELLRQFKAEGCQEAFGEIVQRHLDLVYSVAMRQVAGDAHLAKDVCQEVFAALARKASRLKDRQVVSGWLYYAAKFEASRAVRNEVLRRTREREAGMEQEYLDESEPQVDWEQARPFLDEAIATLKEGDRDALCLRFYESRRFKEIGERLDVGENTARMRVNRSLDKLRALLRKKGIQSSAATLAAALGGQAATAAPAGLATVISSSAVAATGSGFFLTTIGIMNTTKVVGLAAGAVVAVGSAVYITQERGTPEPATEYRIVDTANISSSGATAPPPPEEIDTLEEDEATDPLETAEERYERRKAELLQLNQTGELSDLEHMLRQTILNNEFAMSRKKENPTGGAMSKEEQQVLKRFNELRRTDPESANDYLLANMSEDSSRAMFFMGGSLFGADGNIDMAVDFFKTGIERSGGQNQNLDRRLNRSLGIMLVQQERLDEAKPYLQEAIYLSNEPDNVLHGLYGLAEVNAGNFAAAEYHYRKAVDLNPEVRDWSLGLSRALINQEKYQQANEVLHNLLERIAEE